MPRVLCIWFPKWPIQRLRSEQPALRRAELVFFSGQTQRPAVTVCTDRAERLGLHAGQPLAEAKALLPRAFYLAADPEADRSGLCQLALDCQRFTPLVGLEDSLHPGSLLCDVTGCTHLWNGEEPFLVTVRKYWVGRGYHVQMALTGSVGAAWALARHKLASIIPSGDESLALANLSVNALRLPPETRDRLIELGLTTIGDVFRLPRETLVSRFGVSLPQRLDQALGVLPESFVCERLKEPLTAGREWEVPIDDRLALDRVCRQLLNQLLSKAETKGMGLVEVEADIVTESGTVKIEIRLVQPTRDETHLAQLAELQLERQTWSGGVVSVRWSALRLGRLEQTQSNWLSENQETNGSRAFHTLIDRLSSRLEAKSVLRVELVPDAQPEHVVRLVPWTEGRLRPQETFRIVPELARGRPIRLLDRAVPIEVISINPDGPPLRLTWKGRDCVVMRSWGPERIATGWWRAQDVERDYYRVEWEDGTHMWVYRDPRDRCWFLHGFFD
jgi:protein ImuB